MTAVAYPVPVGLAVHDVANDGNDSSRSRASTVDIHAGARMMNVSDAVGVLRRRDKNMPRGLCSALASAVVTFPLRIMIVDNSGSMNTGDGNKLVPVPGSRNHKMLSCSRWSELGVEVQELATLSHALQARTDFHLLNPAGGYSAFSLCADRWGGIAPLGRAAELEDCFKAMRTQPGGSTPLTEATMQIVSMIEPAAPALRAAGQQVCCIVATDGMPNDPQSFLQAMKRLQTLPVWVVVRLCTDDERTVAYWNELDANLEAPLEVLDDVRGEGEEVTANNGWLTYGPPLHLARTFGLPGKLFDALDEQRLLPSQIKEFVETLLGCDVLPEPEVAGERAFVAAVRAALKAEPCEVVDPASGRLQPWLNMRELERAVRSKDQGECAIM